jgi:nitrogen fixation NifU-like protein
MDKQLLEEIVFRYKHPQHRSGGSGETYHAENLSCGDSITIYLDIQNHHIKSASFDGELCSIANYGADLLLDKLIGQPASTIQNLNSADLLKTKDLLQNPVRLKCFELAQAALKSRPQSRRANKSPKS